MNRLATLAILLAACGNDPSDLTADASPADATANIPDSATDASAEDAMVIPQADAGPDSQTSCTGVPGYGDGADACLFIVAPANCRHRNDSFIKCHLPDQLLEAPTVDKGPVKTVVRRHMTGRCQSSFGTSITMSWPGAEADAEFFYLRDEDLTLSNQDGSPLPSLSVRDLSKWSEIASYHDSCRIWVTFDINTPQ